MEGGRRGGDGERERIEGQRNSNRTNNMFYVMKESAFSCTFTGEGGSDLGSPQTRGADYFPIVYIGPVLANVVLLIMKASDCRRCPAAAHQQNDKGFGNVMPERGGLQQHSTL